MKMKDTQVISESPDSQRTLTCRQSVVSADNDHLTDVHTVAANVLRYF